MTMPLLSEIEFGSYLIYSPQGTSDVSKRSKNVCITVKEDKFLFIKGKPVRAIPFLIENFARKIADSDLKSFISEETTLVPAPRSSPVKTGGLFPAKVICENMARVFKCKTEELIVREMPVPKAAFAKPSERPNASRHFSSLKVVVNPQTEFYKFNSLLVVDDVVTTGSMLLACVSRLKERFPQSNIKAFSLIRTMSKVEITEIVKICRGKITRYGERTSRVP
jgi:hypothetical protein